MGLIQIKDYRYMVNDNDNDNVSYKSSYIFRISWSTWYSLVPNRLTNRYVDWVKSIFH